MHFKMLKEDSNQEVKALLDSVELLTTRPRFELEWSMATATQKQQGLEFLDDIRCRLLEASEEAEKLSRLRQLFEK